jgi:predicted class III extradiol MEMO1 family dioxygenase
MSSRKASHAGSWYTDDGKELSSQLDGWLAAVPSKTEGIGAQSSLEAAVDIPSTGARAIIAP